MIGDGEKFVSALVLPNFEELQDWSNKKGISYLENAELIQNQLVKQLYQDIINDFNVNFGKVEQVKHMELLADEWSVENGLLTATMKLRRKLIKEKYSTLINSIYKKL